MLDASPRSARRDLCGPGEAWSDPNARALSQAPHLVDTTMLFAPRSGGVKRYLTAKADWFQRRRPGVRHTLLVPGGDTRLRAEGLCTIAAARLPFADGYRWPASTRRWADHLVRLEPDLIEAGDPYGPGHAALEAGERLGVPVIGFCHTDPAALAALHLGEWAEPPVRRRWARLFNRFDQVLAPSRHIADRLAGAGVPGVRVQPLGVDVDLFTPERADRAGVLEELGLPPRTRLLAFAGRAAREKNVDCLLEAARRLGQGHHLLLIGAGALSRPQPNATFLPFQRDPARLARLIASADVFVHANDREPFGLVALEALACGTPVVGVSAGGIGEIVDETVGALAPAATAAAIAEAAAAVLEGDLEGLGRAARLRAVERHSWEAVFQSLCGLYGELAGTAPRRAPVVVPLRPALAWAAVG